jgi:hypothetical protein
MLVSLVKQTNKTLLEQISQVSPKFPPAELSTVQTQALKLTVLTRGISTTAAHNPEQLQGKTDPIWWYKYEKSPAKGGVQSLFKC